MVRIAAAFALNAFMAIQSTEARAPSFLSHSPSSVLLVTRDLRGGAGPLDPKTVLKAHTLLQLAQAVPLTLSPSTAILAYKLPKTSITTLFMMEKVFAQLLAYGLFLYAAVFEGRSAIVATALSCAPITLSCTKGLLEGSSLNPAADQISLLLSCIIPIGVLTVVSGSPLVEAVARYLSVFHITIGGFCALAPTLAINILRAPTPDRAMVFLMKCLGWFCLGNGILTYMVLTGSTLAKAAAYSVVAHLICVTSALLVGKDVSKLGMEKSKFVMWMVIHLAVIGTLFDQ